RLPHSPSSEAPRPRRLSTLYNLTLDHLEGSASPARSDRLWPGDTAGFRTNHLSLAWGAAGVLSVLSDAARVQPAWRDWLMARCTDEDLPPGLFVGKAGIAV